MLHLEYKKSDYKGCRIDVQPGNETEIPGLRDMLQHNFMVDNPAMTFARSFKSGGYDGWAEEDIAQEGEVANVLSDIWEDAPIENIMTLFSRALQIIVNLKLGNIWEKFPEITVEEAEELLNEASDDVAPPDWFIMEDSPDDYRKRLKKTDD